MDIKQWKGCDPMSEELFTVEAELEATIDQKTGEALLTILKEINVLLTILKEINKPTPLPPGTCECGAPMPCGR